MIALDMLKTEIDTLPENLAKPVLTFVLFLKERQRAEEEFLWQMVQEAEAYDREHPDEVITVTAEEFMAMTAYMDELP